jgi:hypothetical protein
LTARSFALQSDLARRLPYSPSVSALIGNVVRHPALIRVFVAIWRLPVVNLRVRRADDDAWSGACSGPVGRTGSRGRRAQAVLELPAVEKHYLAGRSKQALRTNLRHARDLGVTSDRILSYEAWMEAGSVILHARPDGLAMAREMDKPAPGTRSSAAHRLQDVSRICSASRDQVALGFGIPSNGSKSTYTSLKWLP